MTANGCEWQAASSKAVYQVIDEAGDAIFFVPASLPPHDRRPIRAETRATLVAAITRGCSTLVTVPAIISQASAGAVNAAFDKSI
jgi:hypothetical protein